MKIMLVSHNKAFECVSGGVCQIVAAEIDDVDVENVAKSIPTDISNSWIHETQSFNIVGVNERARMDLFDVSVGEEKRFDVWETTKCMGGQIFGWNAFEMDLIDECSRDKRITFDYLNRGFILDEW